MLVDECCYQGNTPWAASFVLAPGPRNLVMRQISRSWRYATDSYSDRGVHRHGVCPVFAMRRVVERLKSVRVSGRMSCPARLLLDTSDQK